MKEKLMKKLNKKKGVSLIVLVVTIVIIVVLSTAIIVSVAQNNTIEKAKEATKANNDSTFEEAAKVAYAFVYADEKINNKELDYVKMEQKVQEIVKGQGFAETEVARIEVTENGLNFKEIVDKSKPTIPNGFEYLTGDVESGYVIVNSSDGNEFVWVPVENIEEFVTEDGYYNQALQGFMSKANEPYNNEEEIKEYNAMKTSVLYYGGFYIARYEASNDGNGKAQFKKDTEPWKNICWGKNGTDLDGTGAAGVSRALYSAKRGDLKEKDAISTLVYGVQWDATIRYLSKEYTNIKSDCTGLGNYESDHIINTGSDPKFAQKNIYDMCGNMSEWTMENSGDEAGRYLRGGRYSKVGKNQPISMRNAYNVSEVYGDHEGFRVALYIK